MPPLPSTIQGLLDPQLVADGWRLACALTRSTDDADEVMQDALVVAWRKQQTSLPLEGWPWLALVITNCARNIHRRGQRAGALEKLVKMQGPTPVPGPDRAAELHDLQRQVHEALAALPGHEREAIALCYIGGMSQEQACATAGINLNTLKSRIRRGLERMRLRLQRQEPELAAYLAAAAFPMPRDGIESAIARWQQRAIEGATAATPLSLVRFGIPAAAALVVIGLLAVLAVLNPVDAFAPSPEPAAQGQIASEPGGETARSQRQGAASPGTTGATALPTPVTPGDLPKVTPRPVAKPPDGKESLTPRGPNPVGTLQVRTVWFPGNETIDMQWQELVTAHRAVKQGFYNRFFLNGQLRETGLYENDKREGEWKQYFENGQLDHVGGFRRGTVHGHWLLWHATGAPRGSGTYIDGDRNGRWEFWRADGTRLKTNEYKADKLHGLCIKYDEKGLNPRESHWVDGVQVGEEKPAE